MKSDLRGRIIQLAKQCASPDETGRPVISVRDLDELAAAEGIDGRDLAIMCLQNDVIPERFVRNMNTLTAADQVSLLSANVAVVGLGGLGGTVTEILARAGVGTLTLIDHDRFEGHNLNRQILSSEAALGNSKAAVAMKRVGEIDHLLDVRAFPEYLTQGNGQDLLKGADVIVDCLDSIPARFVLQEIAGRLQRPFVSAAIAGMSAQVMTIYPGDPGLEVIYGNPQDAPEKGIESLIGTLPQTAIMAAAIEGSEVLKVLLNKGRTLRGGILLVDLQDNSFERMQIGTR